MPLLAQAAMHDSSRTTADKMIGLAMWVPGVAWLTSALSALMVVQNFVEPDRIDWLTRIYARGQVLASGSRVHGHVHPSIDPKRTYMFAQNHVNMLDHCTCYPLTPHFKQGIELASHFDIPFYGWFMKQRGTIPVLRDGSPKQALKELTEGVRREVAKGHSLLVFPEGTRSIDGRVGTFQQGVFRIAHQLGLPIVPVSVVGMFEVMRKGEPYINPGHDVHVYMDEPIETADVPKSRIPEIVEQVHARIAARVNDYYDAYHSVRVSQKQDTDAARRSEKEEQGATS